MSLLTTWGYTVTDMDHLPCLLQEGDYAEFTANKHAGDKRLEANLKAASAAIRNYCGWHVYPTMPCSFSERLLNGNGRIKRAGTDILIQLPATYVTDVEGVWVDGEQSEDFDLQTNGLLRIFDVYKHEVNRKTIIRVEYTAGIPDSLAGSLKELAAHQITKALESSGGVTSETAGGVSVTYNAAWVNSARATSLQSAETEVLEPFRLREVF